MGMGWYIPKGYAISYRRGRSSSLVRNGSCKLDENMTIYTLEFEVEDDEVIEQVVEFLQEKFPHLNMEFYESVQDEYLQ